MSQKGILFLPVGNNGRVLPRWFGGICTVGSATVVYAVNMQKRVMFFAAKKPIMLP